ncbi:MAG: hypothetical protein NTV44_00305 [Firmicutes bacterium]|nr:hypothetical protein [Bacillota bacterium]
MKDKLIKYHHKELYYRLRQAALIMFFLVLLGGAVAIPVSIMNVAARASQTSDNSSSQSESQIEAGLRY